MNKEEYKFNYNTLRFPADAQQGIKFEHVRKLEITIAYDNQFSYRGEKYKDTIERAGLFVTRYDDKRNQLYGEVEIHWNGGGMVIDKVLWINQKPEEQEIMVV